MKNIRMLIELRFNESLLFQDMRVLNSIKKLLFEDFPESGYDNNNKALSLVNPKKRSTVTVFSNRFTFQCDTSIEADVFRKKATRIVEVLIKELDIEQINRIGFRSNYGIIFNNMDDAKHFINEKFVNKSFINTLSDDEIEDPIVKVTLSNGKTKTHLKVSNALVQEVEIQNGVQVKSSSEIFADFDVDVFITELTSVDRFSEYFSLLIKQLENVINSVNKYCSGGE